MGEKYKPTEAEIDEAQSTFVRRGFGFGGRRISRREARDLASRLPEARAMVARLRAEMDTTVAEEPQFHEQAGLLESLKPHTPVPDSVIEEQVTMLFADPSDQQTAIIRGEEFNGEDI